MTRRTFVFVILAVIAVAGWRLERLAGIEPRYDQEFFGWWVKSLVTADHLLPAPRPGSSLRDRLEGDPQSAAHQLLRNIFNKPTSVFTLVPLAVMSAAAVVTGATMPVVTGVGILGATAVLLVLALYPLWRPPGPGDGNAAAVGLGAAVLAATLPYLDWFSALGVHNFGMTGLMAAVALSSAALAAPRPIERDSAPRPMERDSAPRPSRRQWGLLAAGQTLALYSHWTDVFLLVPATLAVLLLARRWRDVAIYGAIAAILLSPLVPLLGIEMLRSAADKSHSLGTVTTMVFDQSTHGLVGEMAERARDWWNGAVALVSLPGLGLGLAGLVWMAAFGRQPLPLALVATHLALYCGMSGFSGAHARVWPYALPLLCLGIAQGTVAAWHARQRVLRWGAAGLAAGHLAICLPALGREDVLAERLPEFWEAYFRGQGELRVLAESLRDRVGADGVLLSWGYDIPMLVDLYAPRPVADPSPVDGLALRVRTGELRHYLDLRGQRLPPGAPLYFAVELATNNAEAAKSTPSVPALEDALTSVLGPAGFGLSGRARLGEPVVWHLLSGASRDVTLYRVTME